MNSGTQHGTFFETGPFCSPAKTKKKHTMSMPAPWLKSALNRIVGPLPNGLAFHGFFFMGGPSDHHLRTYDIAAGAFHQPSTPRKIPGSPTELMVVQQAIDNLWITIMGGKDQRRITVVLDLKKLATF